MIKYNYISYRGEMIHMEEKEIRKTDVDRALDECLTVVGLKHYYGGGMVERGTILLCKKEPENEKDPDAISVNLPVVEKVGYIANNTFTVLRGTKSAGRIYDKVGDSFYVKVLFVNDGVALGYVLRDDEEKLEAMWKSGFLEIKSHHDMKKEEKIERLIEDSEDEKNDEKVEKDEDKFEHFIENMIKDKFDIA